MIEALVIAALIRVVPMDTLPAQPYGYDQWPIQRYVKGKWEVSFYYVDNTPVRWFRSSGPFVNYRVWWDYDDDGDVQLDDFVIFGRQYQRPLTLRDLVRLGTFYGGSSDR